MYWRGLPGFSHPDGAWALFRHNVTPLGSVPTLLNDTRLRHTGLTNRFETWRHKTMRRLCSRGRDR